MLHVFGKYSTPSLPSAFLLRVSCVVALHSGLALGHLMQLTGGFQWFHGSFGKVIAHRASPGVSDTVSDRAVSAH